MLLIYLPVITARSEYIFELIFKNEFNIKYQLITDLQVFKDHQEEKINYSNNRINDEFFIKAHSLLSENSIRQIDIIIGGTDQTQVLFFAEECDMKFDIFSAAFFMVSRYEEYLPFMPDAYGRFKAIDSLADKYNFLEIPIVDIWINKLKKALQKKYPSLHFQAAKFTSIVTYDIDVAYKFKGRNFTRNLGSTFKDLMKLDIKNIQERILTLFNKTKDPWDTYDFLKRTIINNNLTSVFFFLLGDNSTNDRNLDYRNPVIKNLITEIKLFSEIGIHPSFLTSTFTEKISIEKERLEKISGEKITKSRQHYLKFNLPKTYNALIDAGIAEDYSMGFPEMPGFRAGTSKPFYFYDLKNEKATSLKIFPVEFMDGSYINSGNTKDEVLSDIYKLIEQVKRVNGTFISIWHNHTVSKTKEFKNWKSIHEEMIRKIISIRNEQEIL